ncbi:hypothetical protein CO015_05505 [candidate division WWE3 bacterium CG_4_8_14_3_um_filter_42_11]|uniref:Uncharacterized protein n=1 Tax=candidate division WWE3 bacterium CG_4_8_14_3_um_filter_42_11 TaxID=1975076 RepID=A0A2M8G5V2_UNCKA|nr:MAG: hypothetical protein AUJ38_02115 [bacterium CG1_02_42_9]PJC68015.1 MAG: hypothetical protein CO015_05505 [candidate division WWE3 bacterium CG_4_8_14_3_um_filter_42_11]
MISCYKQRQGVILRESKDPAKAFFSIELSENFTSIQYKVILIRQLTEKNLALAFYVKNGFAWMFHFVQHD